MSNVVLKGGISNIKYVWRTEGGACKACQTLDGTEYNSAEDIPDRPHPNCKCYIEEVPDEELCDCYELWDQLEELIGDAKSLETAVRTEISDIERIETKYSNFDSEYMQSLINELIRLEDPLNTIWETIGIFLANYFALRDADVIGGDKYFHIKANCESAQKGVIATFMSEVISNLREWVDSYKNVYFKKMTIEASLKDCEEDQKVNKEGRELGKKYPNENSKDILRNKMPKGLPERHR